MVQVQESSAGAQGGASPCRRTIGGWRVGANAEVIGDVREVAGSAL